MRTQFGAALSLFALVFAASPALADPSGFVSAGLGPGRLTIDDVNSLSAYAGNLRGTVHLDLTPEFSAQGDLVFDGANFDGEVIETAIGGAAHLTYRPSDAFLVGGIVQYDHFASGPPDDADFVQRNRVILGGEVLYFLDRATFYAQFGGIAFLTPSDPDLDQTGFFGTAQVRYFLTDDLRIDVHGFAAKSEVTNGLGYGTTAAGAGIGFEYKLDDNPLSLFATADVIRSEGSFERTDARLTVGLKFNFGEDSLFARDRQGPSLDPVAQYPFVPNAL